MMPCRAEAPRGGGRAGEPPQPAALVVVVESPAGTLPPDVVVVVADAEDASVPAPGRGTEAQNWATELWPPAAASRAWKATPCLGPCPAKYAVHRPKAAPPVRSGPRVGVDVAVVPAEPSEPPVVVVVVGTLVVEVSATVVVGPAEVVDVVVVAEPPKSESEAGSDPVAAAAAPPATTNAGTTAASTFVDSSLPSIEPPLVECTFPSTARVLAYEQRRPNAPLPVPVRGKRPPTHRHGPGLGSGLVTVTTEGSGGPSAPAPGEGASVTPEALARTFAAVAANVRLAYVGRPDTVRLALVCLGAEGHLLVEDLPGMGKTTLAKALARSLGLGFTRVQFTADLLPADVTGAVVLDRESGELRYRRGPVFTNVLLADELNRASPKAQSALLEAMEERQVSAEGASHALPRPFMVIATQNPYDAAGTFPLPHSQLDRFLVRLSIGYPDRALEDELLDAHAVRPRPEELPVVAGPWFAEAFRRAARQVHVAVSVRGYVLDLVQATRGHPDVAVGVSPRAALALVHAASAWAASEGRTYVVPDDVKAVAEPVLAHRMVAQRAAALAGAGSSATIAEILARIPVPAGVER